MSPLLKIWFAIAVALVAMSQCAKADALDCLADNIYYEAAFEPHEGKVAVAQVTLNRARDVGDDVCAAVYAKSRNPRTGKKEAAFSWTLGARWRPRGINLGRYAECIDVAVAALDGRLAPVVGDDVKFYHAAYVHPRWARSRYRVTRIGLHIFYRSPS